MGLAWRVWKQRDACKCGGLVRRQAALPHGPPFLGETSLSTAEESSRKICRQCEEKWSRVLGKIHQRRNFESRFRGLTPLRQKWISFQAAKSKLQFLVHYGLFAYFSHKVDEYGVYFFDPLFYETREPFRTNLLLATGLVGDKKKLTSYYFRKYKSVTKLAVLNLECNRFSLNLHKGLSFTLFGTRNI